jgi:hypothetical protein
MRLSSCHRLTLRRLAAVLCAAQSVFSATALAATSGASEPAHEVRDPHYGDTLFHFFQDRYFTSVTNLMVSQHFERVAHHTDEAEVLRGGLLLSYGLEREAGQIFTQLIAQSAAPPVRDRAWFFLAKIRYQRGYLVPAEEALSHVGDQLAPELQEDRVLLQSNLLMARADYAGAARLLEGVDSKLQSARYARFNLGIALIKSGEATRGNAVLNELGLATAGTEELRSLRDRANLALGFAALGDQQPQAARTYLERVRLKGLQSNKALLGLGWAAQALHQPQQALGPWTELAQREISDSAALEARIAIPYVFTELGAHGQALERYQQAIATFTLESSALDESITTIRSGALVDALLARNPGTEMGWFWQMRELPAFPHASHLAQLLAQHEFQEAFKNYRDLRYLAKNLADWREKLSVFSDMLDTRRKAFALRLPQVRARTSEIDLIALRTRRIAVVAEVAQGEEAADGVAFADAKQLEMLARVASVRAAVAVAVADSDPELLPTRERLRLAAGALSWQLAQDTPQRLWAAKKELQVLADQMEQARRGDAALAQAQRDEPLRFEAFTRRIAALDPLLQTLTARLAALSQQQQVALQEIAVDELIRQKERLTSYSTQARFALAQLYDRAKDRVPAEPDDKQDAQHAPRP